MCACVRVCVQCMHACVRCIVFCIDDTFCPTLYILKLPHTVGHGTSHTILPNVGHATFQPQCGPCNLSKQKGQTTAKVDHHTACTNLVYWQSSCHILINTKQSPQLLHMVTPTQRNTASHLCTIQVQTSDRP